MTTCMTGKTMSIDDANPTDWDKVRQKYLQAIEEHEIVCPPKEHTYRPTLDDLMKQTFDDFGNEILPDMVDKPPHYNQGGIECIDYIEQQLGEEYTGYLQGNVIKYLHRFRYKNGLEDLKKAQWYLERLIEHY